jgi:hypothetical protein
MIPSKYEKVYIRQELVIDGQPYTGKVVEVDLGTSLTGSEAVELAVVVNDAFYKLSLPAGINGPAYAAAETEVSLEVADDYILKSGVLQYKYDGTEYTPNENWPNYTFTMPSANVTVVGDLINTASVRYVRENSSGDGASWETASGDIQKMMHELGYLNRTGD